MNVNSSANSLFENSKKEQEDTSRKINGSMQGDLASIEEGYLKTTSIKQIKKEKHQSSTGLLKRADDIEEAKNPLG